jgi:hypothetical protein
MTGLCFTLTMTPGRAQGPSVSTIRRTGLAPEWWRKAPHRQRSGREKRFDLVIAFQGATMGSLISEPPVMCVILSAHAFKSIGSRAETAPAIGRAP